jgi:hypothetical protein
MIRITTARDSAGLTISVDGEVAGECVDVVETFVKQASGSGSPIRLYLRDVTAIDGRGRALLDRLAAQGIRMCAEGVYWSWVVAEISQRHNVPRVA